MGLSLRLISFGSAVAGVNWNTLKIFYHSVSYLQATVLSSDSTDVAAVKETFHVGCHVMHIVLSVHYSEGIFCCGVLVEWAHPGGPLCLDLCFIDAH